MADYAVISSDYAAAFERIRPTASMKYTVASPRSPLDYIEYSMKRKAKTGQVSSLLSQTKIHSNAVDFSKITHPTSTLIGRKPQEPHRSVYVQHSLTYESELCMAFNRFWSVFNLLSQASHCFPPRRRLRSCDVSYAGGARNAHTSATECRFVHLPVV